MADLPITTPAEHPAQPFESGYDRLSAVLGFLGEVVRPDPIAVIPPTFPIAEGSWNLYCTVFCAGRRVDCFGRTVAPGQEALATQGQYQISLVSSPAHDGPFDMELFSERAKQTPKGAERKLRYGGGVLRKVGGLQIIELNSPPARPQVLGAKLVLNLESRVYVWCPNTCSLDCYASRMDQHNVIWCPDIAAWPGSTEIVERAGSSAATAVSVQKYGGNCFLARFTFGHGRLPHGLLHVVKLQIPPLCLAPLVDGTFLLVFPERLAILDSDFREIYSHAPAGFDFAQGLAWAVETIPAGTARGPGASKYFPNCLPAGADDKPWAEDDHVRLRVSAEGWTMVIEISHRDRGYLRYLKRKQAPPLAP